MGSESLSLWQSDPRLLEASGQAHASRYWFCSYSGNFRLNVSEMRALAFKLFHGSSVPANTHTSCRCGFFFVNDSMTGAMGSRSAFRGDNLPRNKITTASAGSRSSMSIPRGMTSTRPFWARLEPNFSPNSSATCASIPFSAAQLARLPQMKESQEYVP